MDFLASLRLAELTKIFDDENLPLTHGVIWNELGRNYRCFCQQDVEVSIFELLDCLADDEQVTLLTPVDYCNIVHNMSLHDTRRIDMDQVPSICIAEEHSGRADQNIPHRGAKGSG